MTIKFLPAASPDNTFSLTRLSHTHTICALHALERAALMPTTRLARKLAYIMKVGNSITKQVVTEYISVIYEAVSSPSSELRKAALRAHRPTRAVRR